MTFLSPVFLWLLPLAIVPLFVPRPLAHKGHAGLRAVILAAVVFGLARPVWFTDDLARHDVVILDGSPSASVDVESVTEFIERMVDAGTRLDRIVVVATADDSVLDALPSALVDRIDDVVRLRGSGSDLGAALEQASAVIPHGAHAAVTIVSDGAATGRGWGAAASDLVRRSVPVHHVELPPAAGERLVGLVAESALRCGEPTTLVATTVGDGTASVTFSADGVAFATVDAVAVAPGVAEARAVFEPSAGGFVTLAVQRGEAIYERTLAVRPPRRAVYLGGRQQQGADRLGELLGAGFAIDDDVARPLRDYDLIVVDDRPIEELPAALQSELIEAVRDEGVGLIAGGGESAFGPGGWHDSALAEALPVDLVQKEEKRDPSTTLVVIIDTSGSMSGERVQLAKEVSRLAMRRLLPHDKVGIVEFYGAKRWAAPIQPASNLIELERALNRLDAGGGTVILPAIEEAFYSLQNVQTRYKHVLVLTDGGVEQGAFEPLLRRMAEKGVNVSTVLVGSSSHSEFLVTIANWGKGRYYSVPNRFNLPEVLLKQPSSAKLPAYLPGPHPVRGSGGPRWWGGVDRAVVPPLGGYVETRSRPGAEVLMSADRTDHPIVASWRYGLGRVTAITTEVVGAGSAPWRDWDAYGTWLAQVARRTSADERAPFHWKIERSGRDVHLVAERLTLGAEPSASHVTGEPIDFTQRGPGRFVARFDVPESEDALVVTPERSLVAWRTPGELEVDPRRVLDLTAATGGSHATTATARDLLSLGRSGRLESFRALWPWLLAAALLLYLIDLAWRRAGWRMA